MARPFPLLAALLAWLLGVAIASGTGHVIDPSAFAAGGIVMLLATLSLHFANEFADFETDARTVRTKYSGGSGVLPSGALSRGVALQASALALASAILIQSGAVIMGLHSWLVLAIMLCGSFLGIMYSLPPLKLAWHGLGEVDNALLGGTFAPILAYVSLTGKLDLVVVLACLPLVLLCFNNLLATSWPDRSADKFAGKLTLATRWSAKRLRLLYWLVFLVCTTVLIWLAMGIVPLAAAMLGFTALPIAFWGGLKYTKVEVVVGASFAMEVWNVLQLIAWVAS